MSSLRRQLSIGIFTAAAAGLTWAVSSGSVENYPATLRYSINLPGETINSVQVMAYPAGGGNPASRSVAGPLAGPVDLLVNGGDPNNASDLGIDYQPWLFAYVTSPAASSSWLRIIKNSNTRVDNTAANPQAIVPVSFSYAAIRRVAVSVNVISPPTGTVTIDSLYFDTSSNQTVEQYYGRTYGSTASQTSASTSVPMAAVDNVSVNGTVTLRFPNGTTNERTLTTQTRNLSSGNATASWTIDLSNLGRLQGNISLGLPSGSAPTSYTVRYSGVSGSSSGVNGAINVPVATPSFAVDLAPGDYDVRLSTSFNTPSSNAETVRSRITITAGGVTTKNFNEVFARTRVDVNVGGFFTTANLTNMQTLLQVVGVSTPANGFQRVGNGVEQLVPTGSTWKSNRTSLTLYDNSNPSLLLNNTLYRYHYTDTDSPAVPVTGALGLTPMGTDAPTLVRTNVYFDVKEPAGSPSIDIAGAQITASRIEYNTDGSLRRNLTTYAYGPAAANPVPGFTVVGEPGTYTLTAIATVNGQTTTFGGPGTTLTFGTPVVTPPSPPQQPGQPPPPPVVVPLADQTTGDHLNVSIAFDHVGGSGGLTTLVENPIGPEPPEGYRMACSGPAANCDPIYYDITTNADWSGGSAKLCVRRRSRLENDNAQFLLKLFRYVNATWQALPDPADGSPAFVECLADLEACGCTLPEDCGIEFHDDYLINAYMVCGQISAAALASFGGFGAQATTSSVPQPGTVTLLQGRYMFTNKVNDVEYTGPNGPPTGLQHFVVPGTGTYRITASGARGAKADSDSSAINGGCGAEIAGDISLTKGDVLDILVGQKGTSATGSNSGGGGGGSFVIKNGVPLFIAGGGGGVRTGATVSGRGGVITLNGGAGSTSAGYTSGFVAGGTSGGGGARVVTYGSGGGGWSGNGTSDGTYGEGGFSFTGPNQGKGGLGKACSGGLAHGGYGGGGAGNGCSGGGGGGGYSGGGGGRIGGGGGSLNTGTNQQNLDGTNPAACTETGHGQVVIDFRNP